MPPLPKPPPLKNILRSRSANERNEESVYNIGGNILPPVMPKVKTYNVAPTSPTGAAAAAAAAASAKPRTHADSSQISNILNPVQGVRDAQQRAGIKPYNHARSNALAVKEASQLNALRKQAAVEQDRLSGGKPSFARSTSAPARRPSGPGILPPAPGAAVPPGGRNFLKENRVGAGVPARPPRPEKEDDAAKYLQKRDYGRVPSYLLERKMELAEAAEAAERAKEAALIPPGMRMLPEEERLETLAILDKNRRDVEKALQTMPIIVETPSQIRRKNELETRLREIEDAFKVFSRPKVLVHL